MAKVNIAVLVLAILLTGVAFAKHGGNLKQIPPRAPSSVIQLCAAMPDADSNEEASCPAVASVFNP